MKRLVGNTLASDQSWAEYADHSADHDDVPEYEPADLGYEDVSEDPFADIESATDYQTGRY